MFQLLVTESNNEMCGYRGGIRTEEGRGRGNNEKTTISLMSKLPCPSDLQEEPSSV